MRKSVSVCEDTLMQQKAEEKRARTKSHPQADEPVSTLCCVLCRRVCYSRIRFCAFLLSWCFMSTQTNRLIRDREGGGGGGVEGDWVPMSKWLSQVLRSAKTEEIQLSPEEHSV